MTTQESLNKIAFDEGFRDFTALMENGSLAYIADRCQKAMILHTQYYLKYLLEDGLGNIDTMQNIDDIIKEYKNIELK